MLRCPDGWETCCPPTLSARWESRPALRVQFDPTIEGPRRGSSVHHLLNSGSGEVRRVSPLFPSCPVTEWRRPVPTCLHRQPSLSALQRFCPLRPAADRAERIEGLTAGGRHPCDPRHLRPLRGPGYAYLEVLR